jgi:hypothetical protein
MDGFGMSAVPRADGLYDIKAFVYRDPAAASLPLWQGVVGGAPKRLAMLDYLPADTALARAGTGDPRQLWKLVRDAVTQVGGPEATREFEKFVAEAGKGIGTNLNDLIAMLGTEQFITVQLSGSQKTPLPGGRIGGEPLSIPEPSALVGCAVLNEAIAGVLEQVLTREEVPVKRSVTGNTTLYTINQAMPLPFPVAFTFAVHRGMFLFGSNVEIVKKAIANAETPLAARPPSVLDKPFAGLPLQANNGVAFVNRRFSETLVKIQDFYLRQAGGVEGGAFARWMKQQTPLQMALVFVNEKDGVAVRGLSTQSGRQVLLAAMMAPVGILAGVAIPSFMQARMAAQASAQMAVQANKHADPNSTRCTNNLRLIDHAKQQWSVAENKADSDIPTAADIVKYLQGGKMPVCPQGGTYQIRAVGQNPTCTVPGHALAE